MKIERSKAIKDKAKRMGSRPASELAPNELEARRAYMRNAKQRSRDKQVAAGKCMTGCGRKPKKGYSTCDACNQVSAESSRKMMLVKRNAKKLIEQGMSANQIATELALEPQYVIKKLKELGLRVKRNDTKRTG